jgi:hypothetical protein
MPMSDLLRSQNITTTMTKKVKNKIMELICRPSKLHIKDWLLKIRA